MAKKKLNATKVTFTFTPELILELHKKSEATGLNMSYIVRKALEKWLREDAPNS